MTQTRSLSNSPPPGRPSATRQLRVASRGTLGHVWRSTLHGLGSMGGVLLLLVILEVISRAGWLPSRYFPPVSQIFRAFFRELGEGSFWTAVGHTLQGWFWGLLLAVVIGVGLGLLLGSSKLLFRALRPVVEFLRPVPSVALIPLAILQFGVGLKSKIFLATFAAVWPILIQTMYGVHDVAPAHLEVARSYQLRRRDVISRIVVPSAIPYAVAGVRLSSAVALILTVTAELVIGAPGLGKAINVAQSSAAIDVMYALILATGLLGWLMNTVFLRSQRIALRRTPPRAERST